MEITTQLTLEQIAQATHAANRELQKIFHEPVDPEWENVPEGHHIKPSSIAAVAQVLDNPSFDTCREQHERWYNERVAAGWRYGPTKDNALKINPALVPYDELPFTQVIKDRVRIALASLLAFGTFPVER